MRLVKRGLGEAPHVPEDGAGVDHGQPRFVRVLADPLRYRGFELGELGEGLAVRVAGGVGGGEGGGDGGGGGWGGRRSDGFGQADDFGEGG